MNIGQFISELETYDQSLPVIIEWSKNKLQPLSYNDICVIENVELSSSYHNVGDALVIKNS